jgi:integrase
MSVERRKTSAGIRYRFVRMVKGRRLRSPLIYLTRDQAETAQAEYVNRYFQTGQTPSISSATSETVLQLMTRRVQWLKEHRSEKHAKDNQLIFSAALKHAPEWATMYPDQIMPEMVEKWSEKWAADLISRGKSRLYVNKALVALQSCWNRPWGTRRHKEADPNPFQIVERFQVEHRAKAMPTDKQAKKVLAAARGEGRLYLEIMAETGARPGEARNLRLEDVSFGPPPMVVLYTRKKRGGHRTPRKVGISEKLAQRIRRWAREKDITYLFQQRGTDEPRTVRWALNIQKAACQAAKIPYFPLHSWRHWHASKKAGEMDLVALRDHLGHESAVTTDKYLHQILGV